MILFMAHLYQVEALPQIYRNVFLGSNASRTPSPMKISSDSMIATAKKPVKPSHGACTLALPCDSNSPSEGEPGGNPKPRKSSAVSVITEEDTMNGRNVMVATIAFGRRRPDKKTTIVETTPHGPP